MIKFLILAFILFQCSGQADEKWKGIKILSSNRSDVERILGAQTSPTGVKGAAKYRTKSAEVFVRYATGSCQDNSNSGLDVPELTVIGITVNPLRGVSPDGFDLEDRAKFEKRKDSDITHQVEYLSESDGLMVILNTEKGLIDSLVYFPTKKQSSELACKR